MRDLPRNSEPLMREWGRKPSSAVAYISCAFPMVPNSSDPLIEINAPMPTMPTRSGTMTAMGSN